jgi:xanthine dehydrogenase molybdenum-binding subunit
MRFDYAHGDVAQGEAESDVVVEDSFSLHYVTHCCMGVSGVIAEFDARANLLLYSNTQVPFLHKREFAEILGWTRGASASSSRPSAAASAPSSTSIPSR